MRLRNIFLLALTMITVIMLTGCSSIAENAAEKAIEGATGVKVDQEGESIKVKTKDGEAELSGGENKIPIGFPEGLVYKGGTIGLTTKASSEDKTHFTVTFETTDKVDKVVEFYKKAIPDSGYEVETTTEISGMHMMSFIKGEGSRGQVTVQNEDSGKTMAHIILEM